MKNQIRRFTTAILVTLLLSGCQPQGASVNASAPADPSPSSSAAPTAQVTEEEELGESKVVFATYESCAVYAGATDFYFKTGAGKTLKFRNSKIDREPPTVKLPVSLVDTSETSEGPPGANPEWVGKDFALTLGEDGQVTSIAVVSSGNDTE